jgi:hypothetical protein
MVDGGGVAVFGGVVRVGACHCVGSAGWKTKEVRDLAEGKTLL